MLSGSQSWNRQSSRLNSGTECWSNGGKATGEDDEDSWGRYSIEECQCNHRVAGIDRVVDAARDCLEWMAENSQEQFAPWPNRLIESAAPLARRLGVHATRIRTDQDARGKIYWLITKGAPLDSRRSQETEQLILSEFGNLSECERRQVIAATREA